MTVVTNPGESEEPTTAEVAAEALDPLLGAVIDGRFRVVGVIGKGAMGKVYRAVQLPLNRAVALKVLDSRYGAGRDESFKQRFLVEAALTSKLSHPNTVRVLDYGTREGLFFLAMEYLDGETLEGALAGGALPWHRALNIGVQVARALREAHELGVVHRDLKPGNVVLLHADDDTDFVKVLDFGLVKSFVEGHELEGRAITQQGMLLGSPPYMAPEQGEQNRADPRSDLYALGTILFEMLTGEPPFGRGGGLDVILKHVNQPVPRLVTPARFEPPPAALVAIVERCLAKSPMDRFQSMDELLLALQDVAVPARLTAPPPAPPPPPVVTEPTPLLEAPLPFARHRGASLLLAGGGLCVAAAAGVLLAWAWVKPAPPTSLALHVESTPPGADVFAEGRRLGVTPLDLEQPLAGAGRASLEVRLEKAGFAPAAVRVTAAGGRLELSQVLSPLPAPAGAPRAGEPQAPPAPVETPKVLTPPAAPAGPEPSTSAPPPPPPAPPRPAPPVVTQAKKPAPAPKRAAPPAPGPRPASRLDEEDELPPAKTELKRPAQP